MKETLEEAADKWVFETNGHKWSNNNNEAGDNFGSFKAGAKWQQERMYSEEEVIAIVEKSRANGLTAEYLLLTDQFKKK